MRIFRLLICCLSIVVLPSVLLAQEEEFPLGDGTELICVEDEFGTYLLRVRVNGGIVEIGFRRARRLLRFRMRRFRRRMRRANRQGLFDLAASFWVSVVMYRCTTAWSAV